MASFGRKQWKLQEFVAHEANVNSLALGRKSGRVLVTGGDDKKVNLWAVGKPNSILTLDGHTTPVECVRFSSTEELVCAGSLSGAIKVWDLEAAKIIRTLTGHKLNIRNVDFHPYGDLLVSGSRDTNIKLWDIRRKGCVITYKGHSSPVNAVKFSPDGQWIASAGDDSLAKIWDLRKGVLTTQLSGHKAPVTCVEFHPNEFLLATGSNDRRVIFWDLETFKMVSTTEADCGPIRCVFFENEGKCLYAGSQDTLKVYSWEPARTHDTLMLNWGKVHDMSCAQSQLIAASFHSQTVSIYVVDWAVRGEDPTMRYGGPPPIPTLNSTKGSRRSFDRNSRFLANRESLSLVKRSEDSDPMTTDPEDELEPGLHIANETDYRAIFQPRSRELRRTPPPPFEPPTPSPDHPPSPLEEPPVVRQSRDSSRVRNGLSNASSMPPPATIPPPRPLPSNVPSAMRSRSESRTELRRRRSPPTQEIPQALPDPAIEYYVSRRGDEDHDKPTKWPVAVPSMLNSTGMKHSPSESSITHLSSGPMRSNISREVVPGMPSGMRLKKSSTVESAMSNQFGMESNQRPDKPIPMNANQSFDLDIEDFLPKKLSSMGLAGELGSNPLAADLSEAEVISSLVKGHNPVVAILRNRLKQLQIVYTTWTSKDPKAAMEVASSLDDDGAMVDFIKALLAKSNAWNLDLCVVSLPELHKLLDSKFESYMSVACDAIKLIVKNFAPVIKSNVASPYQTVGVDITREERHKKSMQCYQSLVSIRSTVMKKQALQGNIGRTLRDLFDTLANLD